ncbi:hypothetical protein, conserved [Eimeria tenella]|uniref:Myosin heavy chain n=1 Tax=Eimeria tenella TaxID=5802 RepID=U6KXY5_EIMTE|nr:hypothetical protein, conserved [Eimeria tenella]CDJ42831.1 hypothetical protein, conserved [Eimeria tenella]|eukprot:XP_013233581.1 hypothetical protein, conserved [Eimeria tenella]
MWKLASPAHVMFLVALSSTEPLSSNEISPSPVVPPGQGYLVETVPSWLVPPVTPDQSQYYHRSSSSPQGLLPFVGGVASTLVLMYLILSCYLHIHTVAAYFTHARYLAEGPSRACVAGGDSAEEFTSPEDLKAVSAANGQLFFLSLADGEAASLTREERLSVADAKCRLNTSVDRLQVLAKELPTAFGDELERKVRERDEIRAHLKLLNWNPGQDVATLLFRSSSFGQGRALSRDVAAAVVAAERVNNPKKRMPSALTEKDKETVQLLVQHLHKEMCDVICVLREQRGIGAVEVERANAISVDAEYTSLQLRSANLLDVSATLEEASREVRELVSQGTRKPKKKSSWRGFMSRLSIGSSKADSRQNLAEQEPQNPSAASKSTGVPTEHAPKSMQGGPSTPLLSRQAPLRRSVSATSRKPPPGPGGHGNRSRQKADKPHRPGPSAVPRRPPLNEDEVTQQIKDLLVWIPKAQSTLDKTCRGVVLDEFDVIVSQGAEMYKFLASVEVEESVSSARRSAFTEARARVHGLLGSLHEQLSDDWLKRVLQSTYAVKCAQRDLLKATIKGSTDRIPHAGDPYMGKALYFKSAVDLAARTLASVSGCGCGFLPCADAGLCDALDDLEALLCNAKSNLEKIVNTTASAWILAVQGRTQTDRPDAPDTPHTSSAEPSTTSQQDKKEHLLKEAANIVELLGSFERPTDTLAELEEILKELCPELAQQEESSTRSPSIRRLLQFTLKSPSLRRSRSTPKSLT